VDTAKRLFGFVCFFTLIAEEKMYDQVFFDISVAYASFVNLSTQTISIRILFLEQPRFLLVFTRSENG